MQAKFLTSGNPYENNLNLKLFQTSIVFSGSLFTTFLLFETIFQTSDNPLSI